MNNQPSDQPTPKKRGPKPGSRNNPKGRPAKLEQPRTVLYAGRVSQEVADVLDSYGKRKTQGERIEAAIRELMTLR